ncbi:hypothetical protein COE55_18850 [Priestia megaterium]|uniref:hypothetical protein n=1 Tax=Priestia megaterium TaxID=1404 RepID=UPI000BFBD730|nr:hypothetical protein [Priestia megaterium]PGZ76775.1 hypothetical protein COE55_18850 [Priestia megaterium]
MNKWLGIPDTKAVDFNISFWSGLSSGLISGLVTGIIAGIAIWIIQEKVQGSQAKKETEKEFAIFIQKLKQKFLLSNELIMSYDGSEYLPQNARSVLEFINEQPLSYWEEKLDENQQKEILRSINTLLNVEIEFKHISNSLNIKIIDLLVKSKGPHFLKQYSTVFYALINDADNTFVKDWFGRQLSLNDNQIDELREQQNEFTDLITQYKDSRSLLLSSSDALKTLITNPNTSI